MREFLFSFNPSAIVVWIIIFSYLVYFLLGRYYFFKKIGEDGIKGIIPIYSEWLYFKRAKQNPIFAVGFMILFIVFFVLSIFITGSREFTGVCTFIQVISLVFYVLMSWQGNRFMSRKFKKGYFTALALTFLPFIAIPVIGLDDRYKWHRFIRIDKDVFSENFYSKNISVGEMCFTNVFMILCVMIEFYIFAYIFVLDIPREFLFHLIWEPEFIAFFAIAFAVIAIAGTLFDYYGNILLNKRRKK